MAHHDDKVWFDEPTKLQQICKEVSSHAAGRDNVLLLSHFEATLSRLGSLLRDLGHKYNQFSSLNPSELCSSTGGKIWLGAANAFRAGIGSSNAGPGSLRIIVAEHYPIRSRDQAVMDAASNLPCAVELCFHFSLDDPVMKHFGAETVKSLFERLGVKRDECISHHLVTAAIRKAQEKIEKQIGRDVPAYSAEDWLKYNLRQTH